MLKVKVNGSPVEIETEWGELKFSKFLKLLTAKDDYNELIGILLDMPADDVKKARILGLENILNAMRFMKTPAQVDPFPKKVGEFTIPQDLRFESVEQFETLKKAINKAAAMDNLTEQTKQLAFYAAIYCQPLNGDDFDEEKAQWLADLFMDYPCTEVMAAGNFFMTKCLSLTSGLPMSYLRKNLPMKKSRLDFSGFLRRSGFTRLWTISLAIWASLTKKPLK